MAQRGTCDGRVGPREEAREPRDAGRPALGDPREALGVALRWRGAASSATRADAGVADRLDAARGRVAAGETPLADELPKPRGALATCVRLRAGAGDVARWRLCGCAAARARGERPRLGSARGDAAGG